MKNQKIKQEKASESKRTGLASEEEKTKRTEETSEKEKSSVSCADKQCPVHGKLRLRGRSFKGFAIKKVPRRVCIEFERIIYVRKYERYMKKKTKIHARLPDCMKDEVTVGDLIQIAETRPISKMIHFVVSKVVRKLE